MKDLINFKLLLIKNGKISFDSISYKEVGEHTYTVKEVKGDNNTITYDETEKQVTVKVTKDGNELKSEVVYPESKTFNNTFTPKETSATIELDKQLSGRDLLMESLASSFMKVQTKFKLFQIKTVKLLSMLFLIKK